MNQRVCLLTEQAMANGRLIVLVWTLNESKKCSDPFFFSLSMLMPFHIKLDLLVTSWFQDGPHSGRHHRYVVICVQGKHTRTPQLWQSSFFLASVRFPQVPPLSLPRNHSCQSPALSYERGVSQTSMACCSPSHLFSGFVFPCRNLYQLPGMIEPSIMGYYWLISTVPASFDV